MSSEFSEQSSPLLPDADVKQLLSGIGKQDKQAFDTLYSLTGTMLYSISYSLMGNEAEAKDAFQEALVKVWKRAKDYDPERGNAVAWLSRITRNTALDKLRARKRRNAATDRAADHFEVLPSASHSSADETADTSMMDREQADRLKTAMAGLPEDQRIAIELAFLKGMTQTEVAEHLQQPLGTIKARIRRGMQKLQTSLRCAPD